MQDTLETSEFLLENLLLDPIRDTLSVIRTHSGNIRKGCTFIEVLLNNIPIRPYQIKLLWCEALDNGLCSACKAEYDIENGCPLTFKPRCGVSKASFLEKLAYPFLQVRWEDVVVWHNRFLQLHRCGLRRETCVQCLLRNVYPDAYALPPTQAEVRVWPLPWRGACQWLRAGVVLPIARAHRYPRFVLTHPAPPTRVPRLPRPLADQPQQADRARNGFYRGAPSAMPSTAIARPGQASWPHLPG